MWPNGVRPNYTGLEGQNQLRLQHVRSKEWLKFLGNQPGLANILLSRQKSIFTIEVLRPIFKTGQAGKKLHQAHTSTVEFAARRSFQPSLNSAVTTVPSRQP